MAKGDHSDLFMTFLDFGGTPIKGESRANLTSNDQISKALLKGFESPNVFEIETFSFSASADDTDPSEIRSAIEKENSQPGKQTKGAPPTPRMTPAQMAQEVKDRLNRQSGPPVREITFTRSVDSTSSYFMKNIVVGKGFQRASLIKRKSAGSHTDSGGLAAGDVHLRIDFDTVLVTKVDWSDDNEEVKESCTFICRKISIQYRPQLPNGKLGAVVPGSWEWKPQSQ
jgi:type VI protein secretion system component Hcp